MNQDKIKGILIGVALGDALGAPHEFKYTAALEYTGKLEHPVKLFNRFQGESVFPVGSVTDDTQMTLTLANQLLVDIEYKEDNVILAYEKWASMGKMLGKNTRELFKGVKTVKGYRNRYAKKFDTPVNEWTQSNGSLMRCAPFVIFKDYEYLEKDIKLSNPHIINIEAGVIYMYILKTLAEDQPLPPIENLLKYVTQEPIKQVILDVKNGAIRDIMKKEVKGWVCTALYCALFAIYHFENPKDAFKFFLGPFCRSKIGKRDIVDKKGDTDTNASILGGLFGAKYGYKKLYSIEKDNIDILLNNNLLLNNIDGVTSGLFEMYLKFK